MPTLYPPVYPDRPDAPLMSFGQSFAEEIARSVLAVVWQGGEDGATPDADVQVAASLTMLEAFHPRNHLECMLAAQGVACHTTLMHCLHLAMHPDTEFAQGVKLRANAAQLSRVFSTLLRDLEHRQVKPLPPRPPSGGEPASQPPPGPKASPAPAPAPAPGAAPARKIRAKKAAAPSKPDEPDDLRTRPDGTPGSMAAYAPQSPPDEEYAPGDPPIMIALATRPKPWRLVNGPIDMPDPAATDVPPAPSRSRPSGLLDPMERIFTGDALARFASARLDPNAPVQPISFVDEDSVFELELLDTGPNPDAEADRAALIAAHPEGKPVVSIRYGHPSRAPEIPEGS